MVAPYRFLTASHVINNPDIPKPEFQHQKGDKYYLLKHDDENRWYCKIFKPEMNKEIFLYPDIDIAIIYLDDKFYQVGDKIYANKDDFTPVSKKFLNHRF